MGEELFVKLRDCFTAGYTLPQYCIDNKIKRPLIVSEKKFELFLWEVYVQFHYDKRMRAQFSFIDGDDTPPKYFPAHPGIIAQLSISKFSSIKLDKFDVIILLTKENIDVKGKKIIRLAELEQFFIRRTYAEIPLLHFLQRHPQVKLFLTAYPSISHYKGGAEFNNQLPTVNEFNRQILNDKSGNVKTTLDKFGYTNEQVLEIASSPQVKINSDGTTMMLSDDTKPLQGIKDGKRMTAFQPETYRNKIYFFGQCIYYGVYTPFDKTLESYLQKMLNENNLPYRIENESQFLFGRTQDILYNLNHLKPNTNDIIFVVLEGLPANNNNIPFVDMRGIFDPPHDYKEIYCVKSHINELGYKLMAERFFKFLTENNFFRDKDFNYPLPPPPCHRYGIPPWAEQDGVKSEIVNEELKAYKQQLKAKKPRIGALVMNCNPFTLGHQYLVEYAAARVDKLYIFVVEEDKSEFPFADRIELVRQGVQKFSNVEVLPSGKFIISQTTFSGYFNKAELQDVQVDSSEDVEIFGREIAPTLGITVRFAGEEPTDNVTRQYNETMKEILPRYGVEFCQIPRKEFDGEPISASKVRAALKVGDFDKIKKLVPKSTLQYLRKRMGQEVKEEPIMSDMTRQDLRTFIG